MIENYDKKSHAHCWTSKNPPCGKKAHARCCLCDIPAPKNGCCDKCWRRCDEPTCTMQYHCCNHSCNCHAKGVEVAPVSDWEEYVKEYFEANYLDGDKIQDGQMISSQACLDAIKDVSSILLQSKAQEIEELVDNRCSRYDIRAVDYFKAIIKSKLL